MNERHFAYGERSIGWTTGHLHIFYPELTKSELWQKHLHLSVEILWVSFSSFCPVKLANAVEKTEVNHWLYKNPDGFVFHTLTVVHFMCPSKITHTGSHGFVFQILTVVHFMCPLKMKHTGSPIAGGQQLHHTLFGV